MKVIFKQIDSKKDISEKDGFGVNLLSAFIVTAVSLGLMKVFRAPVYLIMTLIILYVFFGRKLVRNLFSDKVKKDDIVGDLEFNMDYFTTQNEKVFYSDLKSINLQYNYIKGQQSHPKGIIHNGLAELRFRLKTGNEKLLKFVIENRNQIEDLKPIWKEIYLSGVFIREKMGKYEVKTVMFYADLTYEKIQT